MTVRELIGLLKKQPPYAIVVARGYEGGYDDIHGASLIEVADTQGSGEKGLWWTGRYDDADYASVDHERLEVVAIG